MANWATHEQVEVTGLFKKLDMSDTYLMQLRIPKEGSLISEYHEVQVQDSKFTQQLNELKEGKRERCYFAYFMQDIDIYKVNDRYAMTHSPNEGINIQLIFAEGQFNELLRYANYTE